MSKRKLATTQLIERPKKKSRTTVTKHEKELLRELSKRELKYIDLFKNGTAIGQFADNAQVASGATFDPSQGCLNFVATGDTNLTRTGKKILMKSLRMRFTFKWVGEVNVATFARPEQVRLVIVLDKTANDQFNALPEEFPYGVGGVNAFQNIDNLGKFQVLHDEYINPTLFQQYGDATAANYGGCFAQHKLQLKWKKGIEVTFNSASAADVRQVQSNALHCMMWISNNNEVQVDCAYRSRVTFSDL